MKWNTKKLKEARELAGLTQSQLADKVGVGHQTVSHWEKGTWGVSPPTATKVAEALDVPLSDLRAEDPEPIEAA